MPETVDLTPFRRRVQLVRLWQGLGLGCVLGAAVGCGVILSFRLHGHPAPWGWPVATIAVVALVAGLVNALRAISDKDLADSLDRRADLKNRLGSAVRLQDAPEWGAMVTADAADHLQDVKPKRLYPVRFGRLQLVAGIVLALAIGATLMGNRPVALTVAERTKIAEASETASEIERVLQPYEAKKLDPKKEKEQLRRVAEMRQLAKDLRETKLDKESALQKMHQMEADAKKLEAQQVPQVQEQLSAAEKMEAQADKADDSGSEPTKALAEELSAQKAKLKDRISKLQAQALNANGAENAALNDQIASLQRQLDALSSAEAGLSKEAGQGASNQEKSLEDALQEDSMPGGGGGTDPFAEFKRLKSSLIAATQAEIANIKRRLKTATGAEAEALKKKLAVLEAQLAEAQQQVEAINKAIQAAVKKLKALAKPGGTPSKPQGEVLHTKFTKPMRKVLDALKATVKKIENADDLTQNEVDQLEKMADDMDKEQAKAEDEHDDARAKTAAILAETARKLADQAAAVLVSQAGSGGGGQQGPQAYGNSHEAGPGGYMPTSSEHNDGHVNHLDKPAAGKGKTHETVVDPLQGTGPESYVEVRGPASLGKRSAVPYRTVLPSYNRKAEAALDHGQIPKKHQKRVRAYFESLNGN